ncbi:hypothetical protein BRADI_2g02995v3 [Brachypodium distachyon]|uniref:Uncharacterized protein n=1 Tax=Brachypodium distachyon TaxID=15368 RepID=A0A0Q3FTD6_BRADI|nr:hypothetical protein BRADI_2g02995v3 [Brachypodium distachyon]
MASSKNRSALFLAAALTLVVLATVIVSSCDAEDKCFEPTPTPTCNLVECRKRCGKDSTAYCYMALPPTKDIQPMGVSACCCRPNHAPAISRKLRN